MSTERQLSSVVPESLPTQGSRSRARQARNGKAMPKPDHRPREPLNDGFAEAEAIRFRGAFDATVRLMRDGADTVQTLARIALPMSEADFLDMCEERALAFKCGNPLCSEPHKWAAPVTAFQLDADQRDVIESTAPQLWCSKACEARCRAFAHCLGSRVDRLDVLRKLKGAPERARPAAPASHDPRGGGAAPRLADSILLDSVQERPAVRASRPPLPLPAPAASPPPSDAAPSLSDAALGDEGATGAVHAADEPSPEEPASVQREDDRPGVPGDASGDSAAVPRVAEPDAGGANASGDALSDVDAARLVDGYMPRSRARLQSASLGAPTVDSDERPAPLPRSLPVAAALAAGQRDAAAADGARARAPKPDQAAPPGGPAPRPLRSTASILRSIQEAQGRGPAATSVEDLGTADDYWSDSETSLEGVADAPSAPGPTSTFLSIAHDAGRPAPPRTRTPRRFKPTAPARPSAGGLAAVVAADAQLLSPEAPPDRCVDELEGGVACGEEAAAAMGRGEFEGTLHAGHALHGLAARCPESHEGVLRALMQKVGAEAGSGSASGNAADEAGGPPQSADAAGAGPSTRRDAGDAATAARGDESDEGSLSDGEASADDSDASGDESDDDRERTYADGAESESDDGSSADESDASLDDRAGAQPPEAAATEVNDAVELPSDATAAAPAAAADDAVQELSAASPSVGRPGVQRGSTDAQSTTPQSTARRASSGDLRSARRVSFGDVRIQSFNLSDAPAQCADETAAPEQRRSLPPCSECSSPVASAPQFSAYALDNASCRMAAAPAAAPAAAAPPPQPPADASRSQADSPGSAADVAEAADLHQPPPRPVLVFSVDDAAARTGDGGGATGLSGTLTLSDTSKLQMTEYELEALHGLLSQQVAARARALPAADDSDEPQPSDVEQRSSQLVQECVGEDASSAGPKGDDGSGGPVALGQAQPVKYKRPRLRGGQPVTQPAAAMPPNGAPEGLDQSALDAIRYYLSPLVGGEGVALHAATLAQQARSMDAPAAEQPAADSPELSEDDFDDEDDEQEDDEDDEDDDEEVGDVEFFDDPPPGFALHASPFVLLWTLLGSWTTRATFLYLKGRPVPRGAQPRPDGDLYMIQQSLNSLLRAHLPGMARGLGIKVPISAIEGHLGELVSTLRIREALPAFEPSMVDNLLLVFLSGLSQVHLPACQDVLQPANSVFQDYLGRGRLEVPLFNSLLDRLM